MFSRVAVVIQHISCVTTIIIGCLIYILDTQKNLYTHDEHLIFKRRAEGIITHVFIFLLCLFPVAVFLCTFLLFSWDIVFAVFVFFYASSIVWRYGRFTQQLLKLIGTVLISLTKENYSVIPSWIDVIIWLCMNWNQIHFESIHKVSERIGIVPTDQDLKNPAHLSTNHIVLKSLLMTWYE